MSKNLKILLIIFGFLILANFSVLDFFLIKDRLFSSPSLVGKGTAELEETRVATDSCGLVCQQTISQKIGEELSRLPSPAGQSPVPSGTGQSSISPTVPSKSVAPINGKPKVVYVPLVTSGSAASVSWTEIVPSEFYFDLSNYPNAKEVRFEIYLLSSNNDLVMARLYDVTNKRGVDFSDLQTTNSTFTRVESTSLTIWRGNNKYTVQLRSVNGTQAQLKDARLKILY